MSIVSKKINLHKNNCMSCMQVFCLLFVFVIPETGRLLKTFCMMVSSGYLHLSTSSIIEEKVL